MTDGPVDEGIQNARPAQAEPDIDSEPEGQDAVPAAGPGGETSEETLKRWEASPGA